MEKVTNTYVEELESFLVTLATGFLFALAAHFESGFDLEKGAVLSVMGSCLRQALKPAILQLVASIKTWWGTKDTE